MWSSMLRCLFPLDRFAFRSGINFSMQTVRVVSWWGKRLASGKSTLRREIHSIQTPNASSPTSARLRSTWSCRVWAYLTNWNSMEASTLSSNRESPQQSCAKGSHCRTGQCMSPRIFVANRSLLLVPAPVPRPITRPVYKVWKILVSQPLNKSPSTSPLLPTRHHQISYGDLFR